jgi:hypothetical protein
LPRPHNCAEYSRVGGIEAKNSGHHAWFVFFR